MVFVAGGSAYSDGNKLYKATMLGRATALSITTIRFQHWRNRVVLDS
jgi:hypothetical protein